MDAVDLPAAVQGGPGGAERSQRQLVPRSRCQAKHCVFNPTFPLLFSASFSYLLLGTVLANEEIIDGLSERGAHPVVRQPLRQWVLKITEYADLLAEDLHLPDADADADTVGTKQQKGLQWPEGTLTAQRQWIGRSTGAEVKFVVKLPPAGDSSNSSSASATSPAVAVVSIDVFTTRPDTLMGATYLVLAPEHPLVAQLTSPAQQQAVAAYRARAAAKSDMERTSVGRDKGKTGVSLGATALHPLTGQPLPVWVADYVLAGYGSGAVMAVPAHDERDFEFATLFGLPIKQVIRPAAAAAGAEEASVELPFTEPGLVMSSGAHLDGCTSEEAHQRVLQQLQELSLGGPRVTYKLRDWVFSRQRYWGEPIPIYFPVEMLGSADGSSSSAESSSPAEGAPHRICYERPIPVPESELPLTLPAMSDFHPGDDPSGCLARALHWRYFQRDGQWFARETNTMPQVPNQLLTCAENPANSMLQCTLLQFCLFLCQRNYLPIRSGQAAAGTTCGSRTLRTRRRC